MCCIAYVGRSFLDYRVPVFRELNRLTGGKLFVLYSREVTPERVQKKITDALCDQGIGFSGEVRLGPKIISGFANSTLRIAFQPGLMPALKSIKPDVLIGDGFFQWTAFALAYKALKRVPLVVCYERTSHTEKNAQWYRRLYRKAILNRIDAMACNGLLSKEYAEAIGMDPNRITTGQMVADTENLKTMADGIDAHQRQILRNEWGAPDIAFLTIGRLIGLKGIRELIEAWSRFSSGSSMKCALVIAGTGPEENSLKRRATDLELGSVHFSGEVDYDSIAHYYAASDVFVIPTLEDNWSLVVPEAMACGLPVLCSQYNGCWPEMIQEGVNGWVFDPLDQKSTVDVLKKAKKAKIRLKDMGRVSQEIVKEYSPQNAAKSIFRACQIAIRHERF